MYQVYSCQHIGARARQEDAYMVTGGGASPVLAVLCDGMGGHVGGDVASAVAAEGFANYFRSNDEATVAERLAGALDAANAAIARSVSESGSLEGMGATLVAVLADEDGVRWVSVGDSILWRLSGGVLRRLNADHSIGEFLDQRVARGEISQVDAQMHPDRNALVSVLQGEAINKVDLRGEPTPLAVGDLLIAASDGVLALSQDEIATCITNAVILAEDPANSLVDAVLRKEIDGQDNVTVIILSKAKNVRPASTQRCSLPRQLLLQIIVFVLLALAALCVLFVNYA